MIIKIFLIVLLIGSCQASIVDDEVRVLVLKESEKLGRVFLEGALNGNLEAQVSLGMTYEDGSEVPKDYAMAIYWYTKSAQQGNTDACFLLGNMYADGKGVTKNRKIAYALYNLSSSNGNKNVISLRDSIAKELTTEEINQAHALTRYPKKMWELVKKLNPNIINKK